MPYVFNRLYAEAPDLPSIASVEILNPNIEPGDLAGKYIILDVLAKDGDGDCYNVEIQVRRYGAWVLGAWYKRGLFYLARTLGMQLDAGEDYRHLRAAARIWTYCLNPQHPSAMHSWRKRTSY